MPVSSMEVKMQNYRRLFFLICIIIFSIVASLDASVVISPFEGMSESLDMFILKLGHERSQVQQRAAADIKEMNVTDDNILLAWAKLSLLLSRSGLLEDYTDHWLRTTDAVFCLIDLDKTSAGLLDTLKSDNRDESALALDSFILQLGDENPQEQLHAAEAIKEMNVTDDNILLAWAKVMRLLSEGGIGAPWLQTRDAVIRLIDLDEALGGLLPLLKSDNKDESILARFVIKHIVEALEDSIIKPPSGTVPLLAESLKDSDAQIRETASRLLGIIPTHAEAVVPVLINALNDENHHVRSITVSTLGEIAVAVPAVHPKILKNLKDLNDENQDVRTTTVYVLGAIARAIPEVQLEIIEKLIEMLNAPNFAIPPRGRGAYNNFHVRVAECLQSIGTAAVPSLVEAMNATDAGVRHHAAIALAEIGSEHDEATIPILTEALASPYRVTREFAIYRFVDLAKRPGLVNQVLQALLQVLESTDDTVENRVARPTAVFALDAIITSSPDIVNLDKKLEIAEKLIATLNTPNFVTGHFGRGRSVQPSMSDLSNFHVDVARCLQSIGAAAVPSLVEAMNATDAGVRHHEAIALAGIGSEHDKATIPILAEVLASPHLHTRSDAIYALARLAERASLADEISPIFIKVLETTQDTDVISCDITFYGPIISTLHGDIISTLARIDPPAISALLRSEHPYVQNRVLHTIAKFGMDSSSSDNSSFIIGTDGYIKFVKVDGAIPIIKELLSDEDESIRQSALKALIALDHISTDDLIATLTDVTLRK